MYLKDRRRKAYHCGVLWLYTSMDAGGRLPSDSRQPIMPHWVPDTTGAWHCVILRLIRTDTEHSSSSGLCLLEDKAAGSRSTGSRVAVFRLPLEFVSL